MIVDGKVAFVGGIDMTETLAGDRFDTSEHRALRRLGWHDVGTRLQGPAIADVHDHFVMRWRELSGEQIPALQPPPAAADHDVQVVRTISRQRMYNAVPRGEFRVLESYFRAIRQAQRFIYLENQFLWSPRDRRAPCGKAAQSGRRRPFGSSLCCPPEANNGQDDTSGQLGILAAADGGAGRLLAVTLRSLSGERDDRLYVHAKVGIVDDRWLTVGSANLNSHSLFNDTEMNVVTTDKRLRPGDSRSAVVRASRGGPGRLC